MLIGSSTPPAVGVGPLVEHQMAAPLENGLTFYTAFQTTYALELCQELCKHFRTATVLDNWRRVIYACDVLPKLGIQNMPREAVLGKPM